jgi:hypothetical protein
MVFNLDYFFLCDIIPIMIYSSMYIINNSFSSLLVQFFKLIKKTEYTWGKQKHHFNKKEVSL